MGLLALYWLTIWGSLLGIVVLIVVAGIGSVVFFFGPFFIVYVAYKYFMARTRLDNHGTVLRYQGWKAFKESVAREDEKIKDFQREKERKEAALIEKKRIDAENAYKSRISPNNPKIRPIYDYIEKE